MKRILWAVGWLFYITGWFAIIVWPIRVAIALWQAGIVPSAVEMLPLGLIVVIGIGFVFLGKYLRKRF